MGKCSWVRSVQVATPMGSTKYKLHTSALRNDPILNIRVVYHDKNAYVCINQAVLDPNILFSIEIL